MPHCILKKTSSAVAIAIIITLAGVYNAARAQSNSGLSNQEVYISFIGRHWWVWGKWSVSYCNNSKIEKAVSVLEYGEVKKIGSSVPGSCSDIVYLGESDRLVVVLMHDAVRSYISADRPKDIDSQNGPLFYFVFLIAGLLAAPGAKILDSLREMTWNRYVNYKNIMSDLDRLAEYIVVNIDTVDRQFPPSEILNDYNSGRMAGKIFCPKKIQRRVQSVSQAAEIFKSNRALRQDDKIRIKQLL